MIQNIRRIHGPRCLRLLSSTAGHIKSTPTSLNYKSFLGDITQLPILNDVINSHKGYETIQVFFCAQSNITNNKRRIADSFIELLLPFSNDEVLRESMIKFDKQTIRYGKLFELIDALAGDCGYRHCRITNQPLVFHIVTASVDGMRAFHDIKANENLKLQACISWVGSSSMEVHVDIISAPLGQPERLAGSTQFIMVARDNATGSSHKVLGLENSQEDSVSGQQRANRRKDLAQQSLQMMPPRQEEVDVLHKLFLESRFLKMQKQAIMSKGVDALAGQEKLRKFKYMKHTIQRSVQIMHHQNRNVHGKVFGGHLMRVGFEIGFIAACCFFGTESATHFHSVDDIQFVRPANVGSFMEFSATATYSQAPFAVVEVVVNDVEVESNFKRRTNTLTFVFKCDHESLVPGVMPRDYDEFILYLEGKRVLERILAQE